jgi:hypothetical protein
LRSAASNKWSILAERRGTGRCKPKTVCIQAPDRHFSQPVRQRLGDCTLVPSAEPVDSRLATELPCRAGGICRPKCRLPGAVIIGLRGCPVSGGPCEEVSELTETELTVRASATACTSTVEPTAAISKPMSRLRVSPTAEGGLEDCGWCGRRGRTGCHNRWHAPGTGMPAS